MQPTVIRATLYNGTQLATYDQTKHHLIQKGYLSEGKTAHFLASFVAGVAVALVTSPADVVKTRMMNICAQKPAYSGMVDCY